jgi:hypothetical protein
LLLFFGFSPPEQTQMPLRACLAGAQVWLEDWPDREAICTAAPGKIKKSHNKQNQMYRCDLQNPAMFNVNKNQNHRRQNHI